MIKQLLLPCLLMMALVSRMEAQFSVSLSPISCYYPTSQNTITAMITASSSGVTSYSWTVSGPCTDSVLTIAPTGTNAVLKFNCCGMHTVQVQGYNGSTPGAIGVYTVNLGCPPTISVSATNGSVSCGGNPVTITASGASTYTWSIGQPFAVIVVSPSVNTCYSVVGTNSQGCQGYNSICIPAAPLPNITIMPMSPVCMGQSLTLVGVGAAAYTLNPGMMSGMGVFTIYPFTSTCYTLAGYDGTCTGVAVGCVTVMPTPTLFPSVNNFSQCLGASTTVTLGGAVSYTWFTNPNVYSNSLTVLTTSYTQINVGGTGANGCVTTESMAVWADSTCAMVWPGDANYDGVVNSTDVFELGLYNSSAGAARSPGGNNYAAQYATAWTGKGSNNQNKAHIDCNGDGTVNAADTLAITTNFSLTHAFKTSGSSLNNDVTLVPPQMVPNNSGAWWKVDVLLGSATNVMSNLYGVAFDFTYDDAFVDNGQAGMSFPAGFLSANNQNIPFRRMVSGGGVINCVSVRTDGNNVSGHGKIAEFQFVNKVDQTGQMVLGVTNVRLIDNQGNITAVTGASATVNMVTVGVDQYDIASLISFYPNPSSSELNIKCILGGTVHFRITDVTGRVMAENNFERSASVDVSGLSAGHYLISFDSTNGKATRSLLISR